MVNIIIITKKRPDIVLHDKKDKTYLLIDIAILDDLNINKKETNIKKYKDLEIEVSRMWNVWIKIVPFIIEALRTIKNGLDQKLLLIAEQPSSTEVQKVTVMNNAHISFEVLG